MKTTALMIAMGLLVTGCCTGKQDQLEKAARDWCATIRASQVIPVYPLTEDIQPGDIFLVQVPIDKQQKIYNQKGYLPLDNHLDRLNPLKYRDFYGHSFLAANATNNILPADWMRPGNQLANSWTSAPNAAFPSYSFSVQRGAGINLAFPVEGVPVGLSLLGSDAAEGTVIIKNAHTLGIDTVSLYSELQGWASSNADFLGHFGSVAGTNYLRVVSRVYTVGYVDVSLRDASSRSGGLDAGAAKPVNLLAPQLMQGFSADSATVRSNFLEGSSALQEILAEAVSAKDAVGNLLPGGSLRLTAASGRTISMRETFEPPLTIGYLGFDCSILRGGELGPPIPTFAVLSTNFNLRPVAGPRSQRLLEFAVYQVLREQIPSDHRARAVVEKLDHLVSLVPTSFVQYQTDDNSERNFILVAAQKQSDVLHNPRKSGFELLHSYKAMVELSITNLQNALALPEFTLRERHGTADVKITSDSTMRAVLNQQLKYYRKLLTEMADDPEYQAAMSAAYAYIKERL